MTIGSLFVYDLQTDKSIEVSREPVLGFFFSPNSRYLLWLHYALPNCVSWSIRDFHVEVRQREKKARKDRGRDLRKQRYGKRQKGYRNVAKKYKERGDSPSFFSSLAKCDDSF
jgi:hypothetical protein